MSSNKYELMHIFLHISSFCATSCASTIFFSDALVVYRGANSWAIRNERGRFGRSFRLFLADISHYFSLSIRLASPPSSLPHNFFELCYAIVSKHYIFHNCLFWNIFVFIFLKSHPWLSFIFQTLYESMCKICMMFLLVDISLVSTALNHSYLISNDSSHIHFVAISPQMFSLI